MYVLVCEWWGLTGKGVLVHLYDWADPLPHGLYTLRLVIQETIKQLTYSTTNWGDRTPYIQMCLDKLFRDG